MSSLGEEPVVVLGIAGTSWQECVLWDDRQPIVVGPTSTPRSFWSWNPFVGDGPLIQCRIG